MDNNGKTQFSSNFRTFGLVHISKSGIEALPKHVIKEYIPDIHNCVGTPQISSRDH
jgi:hypothetical protein